MSDVERIAQPEQYFVGHAERECGEHRTVGSHRAWCFDCSEWCYPRIDAACRGCELPALRAALARRDAAIQAVRDMLTELVADKRSLWVSSDSIRSVIEYAAIAAELEKP